MKFQTVSTTGAMEKLAVSAVFLGENIIVA